jgi:vitamin B12 transporter
LINGGRTNDDLFAAYLATTWRAREDVVVHAGLRHDEFDSAGGATTGRAGVAWLLDESRTRLRATIGTGFTAPGADDRHGVPVWGQLGNPDIEPEECAGWDAGVDRDFAGGKAGVSVTYFQNRYRNLFEWETVDFTTFEGMIVNRARAETKGAEVAVRWRPTSAVGASLAYTLLHATNRDDGSRLIRRPRHTLHLDAHWRATLALLVGGGVSFVGGRFDSTNTGNATIDDYTTVRLHASYAVRPELILKLRLENALDENYDEVFGYAALPRAVHGSVEWRF